MQTSQPVVLQMHRPLPVHSVYPGRDLLRPAAFPAGMIRSKKRGPFSPPVAEKDLSPGVIKA